MKNNKWSQKGLKIDDVGLNGAFWTHKKSGVQISSKQWNPFVTDEFLYETLILRTSGSFSKNNYHKIKEISNLKQNNINFNKIYK